MSLFEISDDNAGIDELRLLGQPQLSDHLSYVCNNSVDGETMNRARLADEWREANDVYAELEDEEAGIADDIEVFDLDADIAKLAADAKQDPRYRFTFDTFPTEFAMVELDRLVVFQSHITRQYSETLQQRLGASPSREALLQFCLPSDTPSASVKIQKSGHKRYVFSCESTDFRPHDPVILRPDQIHNHETFGPVSGVVGLVVGFGSNYFTAIGYGDRVMLHNGYHRAHAMKSLGITHAPCIIQTVTRKDELEAAVKSKVADDPSFYFAAARPPLLKDFFDNRLCKTFKMHRTVKKIEVTYDVREFEERV